MAEALRDSNEFEDTIPDEIMGATRLNRHRVRCDYKPDKRAVKFNPNLADVPQCLAESQTREGMRLHRLDHDPPRYQCDAPSNTCYLSYASLKTMERHIKEKHSEDKKINPDEGTPLRRSDRISSRNVPVKPPSSKSRVIDDNDELRDLRKKMTTFERKISEMQFEKEELQGKLEGELNEVKRQLRDVKGELSVVKGELGVVRVELNKCKKTVSSLQEQIGTPTAWEEIEQEEDQEGDEEEDQEGDEEEDQEGDQEEDQEEDEQQQQLKST